MLFGHTYSFMDMFSLICEGRFAVRRPLSSTDTLTISKLVLCCGFCDDPYANERSEK